MTTGTGLIASARRLFVSAMLAVFMPTGIVLGDEPDRFSALLSFSSNYFYRGYSKSANTPTVRANADYQYGVGDHTVYGGVWISRIDFDDRNYPDHADAEIYPYLGANLKLADDWRIDAAVSRYIFAGDIFGRYSDYNEYSLQAHFADLISVRFAAADDLYHRGQPAFDYELTGRYPLTETLEASAGLGYYAARPVLEYDSLYWNAGITWFFGYGSVDLRYVDYTHVSDSHDPNSLVLPYVDPKFVGSISVGF
ncbi:MAG: TorF family putative porin [Methylotetracoccus sp.]